MKRLLSVTLIGAFALSGCASPNEYCNNGACVPRTRSLETPNISARDYAEGCEMAKGLPTECDMDDIGIMCVKPPLTPGC
jgi:hypothetical protein